MSEFAFGLRELFGTIWTGILGVLWWDIRGIRKERDTLKEDIKKEYLTEHTHTLLCSNVTSKFELAVLNAKNEIIAAVKQNGACGNCDEKQDMSHIEE